jgi:tellurite resistance protein TerC
VNDGYLLWGGFIAFILVMLALDLLIFHRRAHVIRFREALAWTVFWIVLAIIFGVGVYIWMGPQSGVEYFTGYLIEKSLSVDNLFVFLLIFSYFSVPAKYEHKILFWGIIGALVMRILFISAGVLLIEQFYWVIYIFGGFLIVGGIRMAFKQKEEIHPERNPLVRLFRRFMPMTTAYESDRFFVRRAGKLVATPLVLVLLVVESTDVVFALDSIPAIFAITRDPFIIYTSNVFAILGLRALYFALVGVLQRLRYLHYGLAGILVFVGAKMLLAEVYHIPVEVALGVVAGLLLVTVVASWVVPPKEEAPAAGPGATIADPEDLPPAEDDE